MDKHLEGIRLHDAQISSSQSLPTELTAEEIRLLQSKIFPLVFYLDKTKTHCLYKESTRKVISFPLSTFKPYQQRTAVFYLL